MTIDFFGPNAPIEVMLSPVDLERCIYALLDRADSFSELAEEWREEGFPETAKMWVASAKRHEDLAQFLREHRNAA